MMVRTTKNEIEVRKFAELADQWWDEAGSFKPLHKINPVRLKYINEVIAKLESLILAQSERWRRA
jgi:2-polyprenyl-6-hydroxyphenyl methylase/3-demethylubiquinone-9 3-methyltransferase